MSKSLDDAVPIILRKIQEDLAAFPNSVDGRHGGVQSRLSALEDLVRKHRRDTAGLPVPAKA